LGAFYCSKTVDANKRPIKNPLSVLCDDTTGKNTAFIVYEKIPGETVKSLLKKGKLNFKQFLSIFIQLLLGLEVAQREARFTHFDLHSDNVMVRENDVDTTYNVHLDMFTYSVVNSEFTPVIIDFGASTCYINNRYIGSYHYMKDGMLNFMIPGHDMYKFLVYCGYEAEPVMKQNIRSLFRFYGENDPYNIKSDANGLFTSQNEYCRKLTFSQAATYTPLMFVEWLLNEYSLESDIFVYNRINYVPIQYSSLIKEYDKIFKYNKVHGIEHVIESIKKCITSTSSYVMTKYNINLLERYNDNLQSDDLSRKIKNLNKYLDKFEDKFIDIDNAMLENVFDIKIPTQKDVELCLIKILSIEIPNPSYNIDEKIKLHIEDTIKELDICLSYEYELSPYLQFYFTILEMQLDNKFSDWIKNFTKSDIYKFYSLNVINTQRAKRWGQSLSAYDNENTIVESPIFQKKLSEIKVLTYNVLHEISKIKVCKEDKCLKNICSFIDKNTKDFDFIGIQEYSNIPKIRQYSKELTKMSVTHDEVPEYLKKYGPVTFYDNKKYKLDDSCNTMKFGFSGQLGRGIQINFFNNNLCIINVHAGHEPKDKINMFDKSLKDYLESAFCDKKCKDIFIKKLQTYKIIMLGDMNNNLDNFTYITIADKQRSLYGRTTKPTCCEEKKTMNGKNVEYGAYDHILTTFAKEFCVKVYRPMDLHSDHDPVSSTLTCD
jgi:tRNA A-37 threonylcarbamoyl transferase component Bud32